ncbi:MAG TPA: hypothetical protein VJ242_03165 [Patescibacteria group bacterium]|nr:hypothetical protein [Patescibacteria group bacterium]
MAEAVIDDRRADVEDKDFDLEEQMAFVNTRLAMEVMADPKYFPDKTINKLMRNGLKELGKPTSRWDSTEAEDFSYQVVLGDEHEPSADTLVVPKSFAKISDSEMDGFKVCAQLEKLVAGISKFVDRNGHKTWLSSRQNEFDALVEGLRPQYALTLQTQMKQRLQTNGHAAQG